MTRPYSSRATSDWHSSSVPRRGARIRGAGGGHARLHAGLLLFRSNEEAARMIDVEKSFMVQMGDAERDSRRRPWHAPYVARLHLLTLAGPK
jgi:hypothetical protein